MVDHLQDRKYSITTTAASEMTLHIEVKRKGILRIHGGQFWGENSRTFECRFFQTYSSDVLPCDVSIFNVSGII